MCCGFQKALDAIIPTVPDMLLKGQGFQSGLVPGTFTRLRSCIVPAEITEPPQN